MKCTVAAPVRQLSMGWWGAQVVLPRAKQVLAATWNPFSATATRQAAAVLGDLLVYVPADSPVLQVSHPAEAACALLLAHAPGLAGVLSPDAASVSCLACARPVIPAVLICTHGYLCPQLHCGEITHAAAAVVHLTC